MRRRSQARCALRYELAPEVADYPDHLAPNQVVASSKLSARAKKVLQQGGLGDVTYSFAA